MRNSEESTDNLHNPARTQSRQAIRQLTHLGVSHTIKKMEISYNPNKNEKNICERQLSFDRASEFDFHTATVDVDNRRDYGETRYVAAGYLDGRLHILCFTETAHGIRVISFRKANARESRKYGKPLTFN